ncbi:hypothetical protein N0V86_007845 [Didymella sp. IMI 355093]|nr:hypothetical protein N0V86_007845 [Didymella sp. IMI 355093]
MFSKATALLALAASATAHMTLKYPVPYGESTLTRNPLGPADFPCKQRAGVYDVTEMNQWNAGETQTIAFSGTAVHGGGSCQFSLTTDSEPTESSQWKVIHSVVGGCPSNVTGNLPDNEAATDGAATFPVTMPENIPDGRYTFAWTWLNKVGNREFYMNCAPIQVGSGSASASTAEVSSALGSLPDMFVANLPDTSCSTTEGEDFNYPDPGQSLVDGNSAALGDKLSGAGCASMTKMGAGNGQLGSPTGGAGAGSSAPAATQPAATSAAASAPAVSAPATSSAPGYSAAPIASAAPSIVVSAPGVYAPGASSAPAATQPAAPVAPVASAAPAAPVAPSTPSTENCTPCTNDGAVVCIGTSSFGLCNRGCAVPQALAAGMACTDGTIGAAAAKRSFPRAHLHKRHGSGLRLI